MFTAVMIIDISPLHWGTQYVPVLHYWLTTVSADALARNDAKTAEVLFAVAVVLFTNDIVCNGCTVEVSERISNFIPLFITDVISYPCWDMS